MSYSNGTANSESWDSLRADVGSSLKNTTTLVDFIAECNINSSSYLRLVIQLIILIAVLPPNCFLLYLLLKNLKSLTPSEVLGLNFAVLSVIYCLSVPMDIVIALGLQVRYLPGIRNAFTILSYIGCPLLLTGMCVERFVAVALPVLFIRLRNWKYRAACSAAIWSFTCTFAVLTFTYTIGVTALAISIVINLLFVVMVACLLGIVWVLGKKSPGEGKAGEQNDSPMKRRALQNIVAVLIPSTVTYFPMLAVAPLIVLIEMLGIKGTNSLLCNVLQLFGVLPNCGICIGPVFYIRRIKEFLCGAKDDASITNVK